MQGVKGFFGLLGDINVNGLNDILLRGNRPDVSVAMALRALERKIMKNRTTRSKDMNADKFFLPVRQ
jgi:hypothetical protein